MFAEQDKNFQDNILDFLHGSLADNYPGKEEEEKNEGDKMSKGKKKSKQGEDLKKKKSSSKKQGRKTGHWEIEENKKYHWFLEIYHTHFLKKHLRRVDRIFKVMENFLGTRQAQQCRSHHQKMEKRHGDFRHILLHLRRQHYSTESTHAVQEDMETNNVSLIDGLVSREQLHSIEKQESEEDIHNSHEEQEVLGMKEDMKNLDNMLQDDYSQGMNFNDFFL